MRSAGLGERMEAGGVRTAISVRANTVDSFDLSVPTERAGVGVQIRPRRPSVKRGGKSGALPKHTVKMRLQCEREQE